MSTALSPEVTAHHQDVLNDLVDIGHELARMTLAEAKTGALPLPKATSLYDSLSRSIRRSVWLVRKLAEPLKTTDRVAVRKQIIRQVEDTIQRETDGRTAASLYAELRERMDAPDLEDEIDGRRVEDIIADMIRDLGLAASAGTHPWKRRKPADLTRLRTQAAAPPVVRSPHPTAAPGTSPPYPAQSPRSDYG